MYCLMPDGTVCWEPSEEDAAVWREEMRDLEFNPEDCE